MSNPGCTVNLRYLVSLLLGLWFGLAGCVMVPIPVAEKKVLAGTPVAEEQLAFLTPQATTKQEVLDHFGNPVVIWEDARVFIYPWKMRQGILFWAVGGASGGAMAGGAGMTDIPKSYLLFIQFDERDLVRRFERTVCPWNNSHAECLKAWVGNAGATAASNPPGKPEQPR